ncbi:FG-GAP-like repeat-containing protein [Streptomyces sp. SID10815]|uniref:FG-GAP-like repeat-containing protein n=1 Tax=Streptomyces sp. SID10815 TaxID=2706027 RepID=UPI0013CB969D|nr:FG-GAP-like repeat-containing protein [Streptomyces sp. SID10815]NEA50268.1 VCBS repeat-containing protein [Streptomyces sp. SID10815]
MARRTTTRCVVAALTVLTVTAGSGSLAVGADAATAVGAKPAQNAQNAQNSRNAVASTAFAAEKVFQADRYTPRADRIHSAGATGYLHVQEGRSGYLWTSYATGATTELGDLPPSAIPSYLGASSDIVADAVSRTGTVVLKDMSTGASTEVTLTHGMYWGAYGGHVLSQASTDDGSRVLWLYGDGAPAEGTLVEGWPTGIRSNFEVLGGDSGTAVVSYGLANGERHLALVDLAAAKVTGDVTVPVAPTSVALSADRLVWFRTRYGVGGTAAHVLDRTDLSAPETTVLLPGTEQGAPSVGIAGRWLVVARSVPPSQSNGADKSGEPLMAVPLTGGEAVTVLRHANTSLVAAPDGGLLAVGGADAGHWAVRGISDPGTGAPTAPALTAVPAVAARIDRLSLENGTLATDEADSGFLSSSVTTRRIAADGTPDAPSWQTWSLGHRTGPYTTGDGRVVAFTAGSNPDGSGSYVQSLSGDAVFYLPSATGSILDVTGRYAVVDGDSPARQYVGDLDGSSAGEPVVTRPVTAASVWGTRLWTPGSGAGVLTAKDLKTGKTVDTVATDAPCTPSDLQAVGRWIYWACGPTGKAGVWDRTAKKNIAVPGGQALLGDGYLVRQDTAAGALLLTAFTGGAPTTRKIGDLVPGDPSLPGVTWTVDKFGGPVAYVDADHRIHLVPSGVATQPLGVVESEASDQSSQNGPATGPWWQWRGLLSKPAASWTATLTSKTTGATVRTLSGGAVSGDLPARWDERDTKGALVPDGAYTFRLTATPADGSGPAATVTQTVRVSEGAAVRRDFTSGATWAPDGTGDLLALTSSGEVSYRPGDGTGGLGKSMPASGWPSSVTLVPFGDLDGDRRNDVLVRFGDGELRVYRTMLGRPFLTSTPHLTLGKGWNQYDVLTSPGDVTGDGLADLIARNASTGELFLYQGTGAGKLAARVRLAGNWSGYKKIVGAGDLNGDGRGDLLAQDRSNTLWRYDGTGAGVFKARVKVATGWGASYNAVVGVGDLTGDGRADLVARDTSGVLWRTDGDGKGSIRARARIGAGWQMYKGLF